jgi:phospholipase D1/2
MCVSLPHVEQLLTSAGHPIADVHPADLDAIIFPGQDYNNARIYDFEGVQDWDHNKLDRTKSLRMGWSDISISLEGPILDNLIDHFSDRWNVILDAKYKDKDPGKYEQVATSRGVTGTHHLGGVTRMEDRVAHGVHRLTGHQEGPGRFESRCHVYSSGSQGSIQLCRRYVSQLGVDSLSTRGTELEHFSYLV